MPDQPDLYDDLQAQVGTVLTESTGSTSPKAPVAIAAALSFPATNAIIDIARNLNRIAEMSGEKPLRKVIILRYKSGEMAPDEAGLFHAWGVAGGNSVAIIETADGTTCTIDPAYVQFIKEDRA